MHNDEMIYTLTVLHKFATGKDKEALGKALDILTKEYDETRTYYMADSALGSYGAYDCIEDAIKQAERIDGNIKTITEVTETRKIVWEKPNYSITKEEVVLQLECSFEYDEEHYLSKDAIDWLIKKLKGEKE